MSIQWLGYAGTTLVMLAYLPQIVHLIREHCSAGLSVKSYLMWGIAAVLLLIYATCCEDSVFIALQSYQLVATALICVFSYRYRNSLCEEHEKADASGSPNA
jgi:uncharacterized protein with PQ loop repeat